VTIEITHLYALPPNGLMSGIMH